PVPTRRSADLVLTGPIGHHKGFFAETPFRDIGGKRHACSIFMIFPMKKHFLQGSFFKIFGKNVMSPLFNGRPTTDKPIVKDHYKEYGNKDFHFIVVSSFLVHDKNRLFKVSLKISFTPCPKGSLIFLDFTPARLLRSGGL